ncbi:MAG: NAD-dependent epimerase/dehydratase family protein [Edaphocola sp.]
MILVTGASGFLGLHLLRALAQGAEPVRALYHSTPPTVQYSNVSWQACNLLDVYAVEEAMQGVDKVFHCAATVSFSGSEAAKMIDDNVLATQHVVDTAVAFGVARLIHVSSVAALGRAVADENSGIITEDTHWTESKANTAYAQSKFMAEMEVWRAMAEGLNAAIVNPSIILGEGNWDKGSANLMRVVDKEFPWYTTGVTGWVDVQDVAAALVLLMYSNVVEERYILSAGNFSYKEIFTLMAHALGRKPPSQLASPLMTEVVWRTEVFKAWLTGKKTAVTKETARTAQTKCFYGNEKFLEQFPSFTYTPIETTIARMATAFLSEKK